MIDYLKFDPSNWMCWICSDGTRFSTYTRAEEYEKKQKTSKAIENPRGVSVNNVYPRCNCEAKTNKEN